MAEAYASTSSGNATPRTTIARRSCKDATSAALATRHSGLNIPLHRTERSRSEIRLPTFHGFAAAMKAAHIANQRVAALMGRRPA